MQAETQGWSRILWNRRQGRLPAGWRIFLLLLATLGVQTGVYVVLASKLGWKEGTARFAYLATALGVLLIFRRWVDRRSLADLGLAWHAHAGRQLAMGFGFGLAAVSLVFGGLWLAGWLDIRSIYAAPLQLLPALAIFALTGLYEEALCRGYLLRNIAEGLEGRWLGFRGALVAGWLISSILFGLMHGGNPNAGQLGLINMTLLGAVLAVPYLITGSLILPAALHTAWNFACGPIFGLPVSGVAPTKSLLTVDLWGPELWAGGAFGPEAGLLVTVSIGLLLGGLIWALRPTSDAWYRRQAEARSTASAPGERPLEPRDPALAGAPSVATAGYGRA